MLLPCNAYNKAESWSVSYTGFEVLGLEKGEPGTGRHNLFDQNLLRLYGMLRHDTSRLESRALAEIAVASCALQQLHPKEAEVKQLVLQLEAETKEKTRRWHSPWPG